MPKGMFERSFTIHLDCGHDAIYPAPMPENDDLIYCRACCAWSSLTVS